MIHHVSLGTNDIDRAKAFYGPVLAVLGLRLLNRDHGLNYGAGKFLLSIITPVDGKPASPGNGVHIAFEARNRAMVDDFYRTALDNGGTNDGAPDLRPEYNGNYYGAFVRDPDGNKIEAVTYSAE